MIRNPSFFIIQYGTHSFNFSDEQRNDEFVYQQFMCLSILLCAMNFMSRECITNLQCVADPSRAQPSSSPAMMPPRVYGALETGHARTLLHPDDTPITTECSHAPSYRTAPPSSPTLHARSHTCLEHQQLVMCPLPACWTRCSRRLWDLRACI